MTGTDELHTKDSDGKLAVLIDRMDGVRLAVIDLTNQVGQVRDAVYKLDVVRATDFERVTARSEVNRKAIDELQRMVDQNYLTANTRDQLQGAGIVAENKERRQADNDILALMEKHNQLDREELSKLLERFDLLAEKIGDLKLYNRMMIGVGGFLSSIVVIYVGGHLLRLFP
jgi:hypothetical protein